MTLYNLITLHDNLSKYLDSELPARASFSIAKFFASTDKDYTLYMEKRNALIYKYADKDDTGALKEENDTYTISPKNLPQFRQELEDLNNLEVDDPTLQLFYVDLLNLHPTPRELAVLIPYILD